MKKATLIKIIVADTAYIIRKGLRALVQENSKCEFVDEVADVKALMQSLKTNVIDVLIVEHCFTDFFTLEVIADIKRRFPDINILVISHENSAEEIRRAINIGIKNYLLKDCDEKEFNDAIISCAKEEKYFCGQIIDSLLEKEIASQGNCATGSISERETEVIRQLASGKRPKEIASLLNLSYHTIVTHKRNIYFKLGINNVIDLAKYAVSTGLVD